MSKREMMTLRALLRHVIDEALEARFPPRVGSATTEDPKGAECQDQEKRFAAVRPSTMVDAGEWQKLMEMASDAIDTSTVRTRNGSRVRTSSPSARKRKSAA